MWLVIGYGSPLHSDDRFGHAVAERVQTLADPGSTEVVITTQLMPELAEPISRAEGVVFVDANADLPPARLEFKNLSAPQASAPDIPSAFTHHCTPATLLEAALVLYGRAPEAWLCSAGSQTFALGEALSPALADVVPVAAARILEVIGASPA